MVERRRSLSPPGSAWRAERPGISKGKSGVRKISAKKVAAKKVVPVVVPPLKLPEMGATLELTVAERVRLRQEAHRLNPVVLMGQSGMTEALLLEIERALRAHGLIKVKASGVDTVEARSALANILTQRLSAASVQQIGKILVLYRPR
ncbi:YhbY family RNA-binding protein [Ferrovum myxofaciens]|uniref:YhbY family RNA-binding protein n=1 Tax=Ferrovum myxofaciens TaxID=416213 RepID=UPI0023545BAE|nr:YhbY family RNA-binding protein [Ferrovum myxofaciens]MBU6995135.1 YhbY family RNA-binding protein [Ferrovum myxofaciens]QKE41512.1 MAG: YhbY family RNA-binding protein [Ferrovum myxofaciens]